MSRKALFYLFAVISLVLTICLDLFVFELFKIDTFLLFGCSIVLFPCFLLLLISVYCICVTNNKKYWIVQFIGGFFSTVFIVSVILLVNSNKSDAHFFLIGVISAISLIIAFVFLVLSRGLDEKIGAVTIETNISEREYNKLVRDNIPDIIDANGEIAFTRVLDDADYKNELEKKLYEEYNEVLNSFGGKRLEELADMIEVISALAKLENKSLQDILDLADLKKVRCGAFDKKIFLEKVMSARK